MSITGMEFGMTTVARTSNYGPSLNRQDSVWWTRSSGRVASWLCMKVLILVSSDLVVDVDDFCLYMEADPDTFDETRGELILRKAQSLCESFVSPLPTGADAVVLDAVRR